ncbi:hypothetical protein AAG906_026335 [Vitis piasezkii]
MKRDIAQFVANCQICQQVKVEHQRPAGLLQPLPILEWKWDHITMDFVIRLSRTRNKKNGVWSLLITTISNLVFAWHIMKHSIRDLSFVGTEIVQETIEKYNYQGKLKTTQDRHKSYADQKRRPLEFEEGIRYKRVGLVAYKLILPQQLSFVHDVFHVSMLRKCTRIQLR